MKTVAAFALTFVVSPYAGASSFAPLFTKASTGPMKAGALQSIADATATYPRVQMDTAVLGFNQFSVDWSGESRTAETVVSYRRTDGETFMFRIGDDALSVVTTFYGRPALGHITVDGETYFIAPEGDHYVIAPSSSRQLPRENLLHVADAIPEPRIVEPESTATTSRRRSVRHPGPPAPKYKAYLAGIMLTSYIDAVNAEVHDPAQARQMALDRMQHMLDYTNTALANSGYWEGRLYFREIAVMDMGDMETKDQDLIWATTNPEVQAFLAKTKAFGKFIVSQKVAGEGARNSLRAIIPKYQNIIGGSFFASWDDTDIQLAGHLLGHTLAMDHNVEAEVVPTALDPIPFARAAYDCQAGVYDIMSYNPCGKPLKRVQSYSSPITVMNGVQLGSESRNDRRAAELMFPYISGDFD